MPKIRTFLCVMAAAGLAVVLAGAARADTKITIGMVPGGSGFHIPTYVAMAEGYYKDEGLDASFVELPGGALVKAGLTGAVDFAPIPGGGSLAALKGAPLVYVVGESLKSQWTIVVPKSIRKVTDLKGKTLAYGQEGGANYDEGVATLSRFFHMEAGRDYKVISFRSQPGEVAALVNGDVSGALLSAVHAAVAVKAGYHILIRTGDYLPRVGGTIWTIRSFYNGHKPAVRGFIRAIARAVMYFRDNKQGSIPILQKYLGVKDRAEAGIIWDQIHNDFGAEVPKALFAKVFSARRKLMIAAHEWPASKPLPDPEQFLARKLLETTLKNMHYVPTKIRLVQH